MYVNDSVGRGPCSCIIALVQWWRHLDMVATGQQQETLIKQQWWRPVLTGLLTNDVETAGAVGQFLRHWQR